MTGYANSDIFSSDFITNEVMNVINSVFRMKTNHSGEYIMCIYHTLRTEGGIPGHLPFEKIPHLVGTIDRVTGDCLIGQLYKFVHLVPISPTKSGLNVPASDHFSSVSYGVGTSNNFAASFFHMQQFFLFLIIWVDDALVIEIAKC